MEHIEAQPLELAIILFGIIAAGCMCLRESDATKLFGASMLLGIAFYSFG